MKKEFELYQDEEGNVYDITTDLEQIIIKDLYKAMKRNNEKQEEIERLNNIINELEKWAEDYRFANIFKNKLQELKGSDKE